MKKIIILSVITLLSTITFAQFDEKFYRPSKEIVEMDSIDYKEYFIDIDDDRLNYVIFKPKGNFNKKTIFYYHGAGGNISQYANSIRPLVEGGYQLVMIDFRGYGKSTGTPTHKNIASDAQIIFDVLMKRKDIKKTTIINYGASLGSQIATHMALENKDKVAALVLDGGMSSFTDIALFHSPEEQKMIISAYVTSPYSSKNDLKSLVNIPLLIIHSEEDKAVPLSQAQTNFENAASTTKELLLFEGEHLASTLVATQEILDKLKEMTH